MSIEKNKLNKCAEKDKSCNIIRNNIFESLVADIESDLRRLSFQMVESLDIDTMNINFDTEVQYLYDEFIEDYHSGKAEIEIINNKCVGFISYENYGTSSDQAQVVMLKRAIVDKDYRDHGLYTNLRNRIIYKINSSYKNPILLSVTNNMSVINRNNVDGWKEIGLEDADKIMKVNIIKDKNYRAFKYRDSI